MPDELDLNALQRGDQDAWEVAFRWLWPAATTVVASKLGRDLFRDVEDVSIIAISKLVRTLNKQRWVKTPMLLRNLLVSIAYDEACTYLRKHLAEKRGAGLVGSIEEFETALQVRDCSATETESLIIERAIFVDRLFRELKSQQREILADFYLRELSYSEIASKHGIACGSVGVYLRRGLKTIRDALASQPRLTDEGRGFARLPMMGLISCFLIWV